MSLTNVFLSVLSGTSLDKEKKKKEPCPRLGHGDQISNLSKEFEDEFKNNKTETIVIAHV